jgi:hypothetical protein
MKRMRLLMVAVAFLALATAVRADWMTSQRLTWTTGQSYSPAVAVDSSGGVHVVWEDLTPGNYEIYYKRSTDDGVTWLTSQRLTWTSSISWDPTIAVDPSDHIHVAWHDQTPGNFAIYYKRSTDGGATWTASQRLTCTSDDCLLPAMAVDSSGHLHLVWHQSMTGSFEIQYKRSTDGGITWSAAQRLTWTADSSTSAAIAIGHSDSLHVVWEDHTPGDAEIYYKKSVDGGMTWTTSQRLTWISGWSQFAAIAGDLSGNLHLVWDEGAPGEVYYKKSSNAGTTWTTSRRLTWTLGYSYAPSIVVDSSANLHLTWHDNTVDNFEIYYKMSGDGGTTWTTSQRLTWTSNSSGWTSLAAGPSGILHLVWQDATPGNDEIYYKKDN